MVMELERGGKDEDFLFTCIGVLKCEMGEAVVRLLTFGKLLYLHLYRLLHRQFTDVSVQGELCYTVA